MRVYLQKIIKGLEDKINSKLKQIAADRKEWRNIRAKIEKEERKKFERDKIKAKYKNEVLKVKAKIKRGPLWKQIAGYSLDVVKEVFKDTEKPKK